MSLKKAHRARRLRTRETIRESETQWDLDGYLCLMIGDVCERGTGNTTNLATQVWEDVARPLG